MQVSASSGFDWKDGLLVASGFAILILLQFFVRATFGFDLGSGTLHVLALPALFGPVAARRAIWGPPRLGAMRTGVLFRLLSIAGLLLVFFGLGAGAIMMSRLSRATDPKPDFEAVERAIYAPTADFDIGPANESTEARERRQQSDRVELDARIKKDAAEAEKLWLENDAEHKRLDWLFVLATIGLLAIGSFFLSLRYEKYSPEAPALNSKR